MESRMSLLVYCDRMVQVYRIIFQDRIAQLVDEDNSDLGPRVRDCELTGVVRS